MSNPKDINIELFRSINEKDADDVPSIFKRSILSFPCGDSLAEKYNDLEYYCLVINIGAEGYVAVCGECLGETGSGDTEEEAVQDLSERCSVHIEDFGDIFNPSSEDEQRRITQDTIGNFKRDGYTIISEKIVSFKLQKF